MLEELFRRPPHVRRLRANPLGALFDPLTELLTRRGHGPGLIHQYVRAVEHFGYWLGAGYPVVAVEQVTTASVRQFLQEHLPHCTCTAGFPRGRGLNLAVLRHLLRMLAQQDPSRLLPPPSPHDSRPGAGGVSRHPACISTRDDLRSTNPGPGLLGVLPALGKWRAGVPIHSRGFAQPPPAVRLTSGRR